MVDKEARQAAVTFLSYLRDSYGEILERDKSSGHERKAFQDSYAMCATILTMIEEQEPRIMSLEEAKAADSLWLEDIDKEAVVPAICFGSIDYADEHRRTGFMARYGRCTFKSICPRDDEYMVRWRPWTAEPDKAAREAAPWT